MVPGREEELLRTGVMRGPDGTEWGRLTLDKVFIINHPALYKWLVRYSYVVRKDTIPVSDINQRWSMRGTSAHDPYVMAALATLEEVGAIKQLSTLESGRITHVKFHLSPAMALKKIPKYTTRAGVMAGLEPLPDARM